MMYRRTLLRAAAATLAATGLATGDTDTEPVRCAEADTERTVTVTDWDLTRGVLTVRFADAGRGDTVRLVFHSIGVEWTLDRTLNGSEHVEDIEHAGPACPTIWEQAELVAVEVTDR